MLNVNDIPEEYVRYIALPASPTLRLRLAKSTPKAVWLAGSSMLPHAC